MLRKLWRKKVMVVFVAALLVLFPAASVRPAQALSKHIFLSVGIEKTAEGFTVIGAAAAGTEEPKQVEASGATIEEALAQITADQGRGVSLAHCNCIVLGASLVTENIAEVLEYFVKKFEISNNVLLVWTDADVKKVLELSFAGKSDSPGGLVETIGAYNQETLFKRPLTLDRFYKDYLNGRDAYMSAITLTDDEITNTKKLAAFTDGLYKNLVARAAAV